MTSSQAMPAEEPRVLAVCRSGRHSFSKPRALQIRLIAGFGVEGDAHADATVKHRSRVARDAALPNLRQTHLIHAELFDELAAAGFEVGPGDVGENITTRGVDLLGLPAGARLRLGERAVVEITGLRNPCHQLDDFQSGLMRAMLGRDAAGEPIRKCGVMAIVLESGVVQPGDPIAVELPEGPHHRLRVV
jgi:MOSC domain-containing protein YiiM